MIVVTQLTQRSGGIGVGAALWLLAAGCPMSPELGDDHVAGGAVDQYAGTTLSIAWRDGGKK